MFSNCLIVPMALSPKKDGALGKLMDDILKESVYQASPNSKFAISNRFPAGDSTICQKQMERLLELGIKREQILAPESPSSRNTFDEVSWAVKMAKDGGFDKVLFVTTYIHKNRTLAAFKKLGFYEVYGIGLYGGYGFGYVQHRFLHPMSFYVYELLAYLYSMVKGWV